MLHNTTQYMTTKQTTRRYNKTTKLHSTTRFIKLHYTIPQHNSIHHIIMQCNTIYYNITQYSINKCNTEKNMIQQNKTTTQHNITN